MKYFINNREVTENEWNNFVWIPECKVVKKENDNVKKREEVNDVSDSTLIQTSENLGQLSLF